MMKIVKLNLIIIILNWPIARYRHTIEDEKWIFSEKTKVKNLNLKFKNQVETKFKSWNLNSKD